MTILTDAIKRLTTVYTDHVFNQEYRISVNPCYNNVALVPEDVAIKMNLRL